MTDPADFFNEQNAFIRLQEDFRRAEEARQRYLKAQTEGAQNINQSEENLLTVVNSASSKVDALNKESLDAITRLENMQLNPDFINEIMGIFNPDYNADYQKRRLDRVSYQLQLEQQKVDRAGVTHSFNVNRAERRTKTAAAAEVAARQLVQGEGELIALGMQIENDVTEEDKTFVANQDIETLKKWQTNPPKRLAGKPGLINAYLRQKEMSVVGLDLQNLQAQLSTEAVSQMGRDKVFASTTDAELNKWQDEPNRMPPNIALGHVQAEIKRRSMQNEQLRREKLLNDAGEHGLAQQEKDALAQTLTLAEVEIGLKEAAQSADGLAHFTRQVGSETITTTFSLNDLTVLADAKRTQLQERLVKATDRAGIQAKAQSDQINLGREMVNIAKEANPGGGVNLENPIESVPPEVAAVLEESNTRLKYLEDMRKAAEGNPNIQYGLDVEISKTISDMKKQVDGVRDNMVKRADEKSRPAIEEYLKQGRVVNIDNAAQHMATSAGNSEAFNFNPVMDGPWRQLAAKYREIASAAGGTSFQFSEGNFQMVKEGSKDANIHLENAIKASGFRDSVAERVLQATLSEVLLEQDRNWTQRTSQADPGQIVPSPYARLVNTSNGNLAPDFFSVTPEGKRRFEPANVNIKLSDMNLELRRQGVLAADETLQEPIYQAIAGRTRDNMTARFLGANALEASVAAFAFNNNLGQAVQKKLVALEGTVAAAELRAVELRKEREARALAETLLQGGDPNMVGPLNQPNKQQKTILDMFPNGGP